MNKNLILTALMALPLLLSSCMDNDSSYHGFSSVSLSGAYANPSEGYLAFVALGSWKITQTSGTEDWYTLGLTEGDGGYYYAIHVDFAGNTTGSYRTTSVRIQDTGDSDTYFTATLIQYGTRADGALGSAPNVSNISGDDGSEIDIEYDDYWRPTYLGMTIDGTLKHSLNISYDTTDSLITVKSTAADNLTGSYTTGFLPADYLISETDTVGYYDAGSVTSGGGVQVKVEYHKSSGEQYGSSLLYMSQSFSTDDEHVADSLKFHHTYASTDDRDVVNEALACTYSDVSNRNTSVDVNQLLFGADECNPYLLLGMFRNMRCSYVLSKAKGSDGSYTVSTETNSDGSISEMTVTDKDGETVTYTFTY